MGVQFLEAGGNHTPYRPKQILFINPQHACPRRCTQQNDVEALCGTKLMLSPHGIHLDEVGHRSPQVGKHLVHVVGRAARHGGHRHHGRDAGYHGAALTQMSEVPRNLRWLEADDGILYGEEI